MLKAGRGKPGEEKANGFQDPIRGLGVAVAQHRLGEGKDQLAMELLAREGLELSARDAFEKRSVERAEVGGLGLGQRLPEPGRQRQDQLGGRLGTESAGDFWAVVFHGGLPSSGGHSCSGSNSSSNSSMARSSTPRICRRVDGWIVPRRTPFLNSFTR